MTQKLDHRPVGKKQIDKSGLSWANIYTTAERDWVLECKQDEDTEMRSPPFSQNPQWGLTSGY